MIYCYLIFFLFTLIKCGNSWKNFSGPKQATYFVLAKKRIRRCCSLSCSGTVGVGACQRGSGGTGGGAVNLRIDWEVSDAVW